MDRKLYRWICEKLPLQPRVAGTQMKPIALCFVLPFNLWWATLSVYHCCWLWLRLRHYRWSTTGVTKREGGCYLTSNAVHYIKIQGLHFLLQTFDTAEGNRCHVGTGDRLWSILSHLLPIGMAYSSFPCNTNYSAREPQMSAGHNRAKTRHACTPSC